MATPVPADYPWGRRGGEGARMGCNRSHATLLQRHMHLHAQADPSELKALAGVFGERDAAIRTGMNVGGTRYEVGREEEAIYLVAWSLHASHMARTAPTMAMVVPGTRTGAPLPPSCGVRAHHGRHARDLRGRSCVQGGRGRWRWPW